MKNKNLIKLVFTGLMAALVCVSTAVLVIPLPTGGFANLGDCFVIIAGYMLGPVYGALADVLGNAVQGVFGCVTSVIVYTVLDRTKLFNQADKLTGASY